MSEILNERCLHASVKAVYFGGRHTYRPVEPKVLKVYAEDTERFTAEFPRDFRPEPDVIYNAALAGYQKEVYGPGLEAAGFVLMQTSINPNTQREINLYVLAPGDF